MSGDTQEIEMLAVAALAAAVQDPPDAAGTVEVLNRLLVIRPAASGLFSAMVLWSVAALAGRHVEERHIGVTAWNPDTGERIDAEQLTDSAQGWGLVNAMRFIVFAVTGDLGGARAVFDAAPDEDAAHELVRWVLFTAAQETKQRMRAGQS